MTLIDRGQRNGYFICNTIHVPAGPGRYKKQLVSNILPAIQPNKNVFSFRQSGQHYDYEKNETMANYKNIIL